jgi:hypothetical protein
MRFVILLLAAACLSAPLAASAAPAASFRPPGIAATADGMIELASPRCGPRAHYVRGHRARNGQWINGRCVRDRRHG